MKTKLTVTIDRDLVPRAKRRAKRQGISLSQMIENALREPPTDTDDFPAKWLGKFKVTSKADLRSRYLRAKYDANSD